MIIIEEVKLLLWRNENVGMLGKPRGQRSRAAFGGTEDEEVGLRQSISNRLHYRKAFIVILLCTTAKGGQPPIYSRRKKRSQVRHQLIQMVPAPQCEHGKVEQAANDDES